MVCFSNQLNFKKTRFIELTFLLHNCKKFFVLGCKSWQKIKMFKKNIEIASK